MRLLPDDCGEKPRISDHLKLSPRLYEKAGEIVGSFEKLWEIVGKLWESRGNPWGKCKNWGLTRLFRFMLLFAVYARRYVVELKKVEKFLQLL